MAFLSKKTKIALLEITFNGATKRYASTILPTTIGGVTYEPLSFTYDPIQLSQENTSGNLNLKLSAWFKDKKAIIDMNYDVRIELKHYQNATTTTVFKGKVQTAKIDTNTIQISATQVAAGLGLTIPDKLYSGNCQHALYSTACGVSKADWTSAGKILTVTNRKTFSIQIDTVAPKGLPPDYSIAAILNKRTNEERLIKSNSSGTITTVREFSDVKDGDLIEIYAGCAKQRVANCRNQFENEINFYGCDRAPGQNPFKNPLK